MFNYLRLKLKTIEKNRELSKSVNDFLGCTTQENDTNSKINLMYDNKEQNFRKIPLNPYLTQISFDKGISKMYSDKLCDDGKILFEEIRELQSDGECLYSNKSYSSIFGLFYLAYSNHTSLFIRPDDIWLHIITQIQIIINSNSEKLRHLFVKHEGKANLDSVVRPDDIKTDFKKSVLVWNNLINETNVKNNFTQIIKSKFSTTSDFDNFLYNIVILASFKEYYTYSLTATCGIRNIYFGGSIDDWILIKNNLILLKEYGIEIKIYVEKIINIIDKFIEAIETKPDIVFFNKIMRTDAQAVGTFVISLGYGSNTETIEKYVDGWIRDLYYFSPTVNQDELLPANFKEYVLTCPFSVGNKNCLIRMVSGEIFKYHKEFDSYSIVNKYEVVVEEDKLKIGENI